MGQGLGHEKRRPGPYGVKCERQMEGARGGVMSAAGAYPVLRSVGQLAARRGMIWRRLQEMNLRTREAGGVHALTKSPDQV